MWKLSSVLFESQAFLRRLRESQLWTSGDPLQPYTSASGPGSSVGGIDRVSNPVKLPSLREPGSFFSFGLSVPAVKGYWAALNHVFSLTGMDLAASSDVSCMFQNFKRSCPPREIRPLDWNLSLVLRCLSRPPFEPLKLTSDNHLTWQMSFLLARALPKRVSELHGLSFQVCLSCSWRSCTFSFLPDFMAKTQNPYIPDSHFEDFIGGDQDELLLCPIRARHKYLTQTEQYWPGIEGLLISTGRHSVITLAHVSASEEDCQSLRVGAHEVRKVASLTQILCSPSHLLHKSAMIRDQVCPSSNKEGCLLTHLFAIYKPDPLVCTAHLSPHPIV